VLEAVCAISDDREAWSRSTGLRHCQRTDSIYRRFDFPAYPGENVGLRAGSLQTPDEQLEVTASSAASPVNEAAVDGHRPVCARAVQRNHGLRDNDLVDSRANAQRPIADRPVIHFVADREKLPHHCGRLPIRHLCRQARLEGLQLRRRTLGDDGPQWPKRHIQEERWITITRDDARAAEGDRAEVTMKIVVRVELIPDWGEGA
jgi:hypothetical protein